MNIEPTKTLVCIYNFLPYVNTSANVMAKRIYENNEKVDVLHNKMHLEKDERFSNFIYENFIEEDLFTNVPPAFSYWPRTKKFLEEATKKLVNRIYKKGHYEKMYSRSMFPASHLIAFNYKMLNPEVKWIAEFADPHIIDSKGKIFYSQVDEEYIEEINKYLEKYNMPITNCDDMFFYVEYLPYLFADKIVFTNENQRKLMLNHFKFPNEEIKEKVLNKSVINPHPTPDKKLYSMMETTYPHINDNKVNLAYFGVFYNIRNIYNVLATIFTLDNSLQEKCLIHLFVPNKEELKEFINHMPIKNNIILNDYVSFLEFLNLTTKFDCLICNDSKTNHLPGPNPYLPSKISDYLGSGTDIWGICERDSPMSKMDIPYKSFMDNIFTVRSELEKIIKDKSKNLDEQKVKNKKGISIISRFFNENEDITSFLNSLQNQTLNNNLFEILIIIDKENKNSINKLTYFKEKYPQINIKIIEINNIDSLSIKNIINFIDYEYTIFIDVKDTVSPNYLRSLLKFSSVNRIVLGKVFCYAEDKQIETEDSIFINKFDEIIPIESFSEHLFINIINKLIPSSYLKRYNSSENFTYFNEIDFLTKIVSIYNLDFFVVNSKEEAKYNLNVDCNNDDDYEKYSEIDIVENIKILKSLDSSLENSNNMIIKNNIDLIINNEEYNPIFKYLENNPTEYEKIINLINEYGIKNLNKNNLNNYHLKKGICVLTPCYKAESFIDTFLESMYNQTLNYSLFEILIIMNGERDRTESIIQDFIEEHPEINIRIIESEKGATTARNKGIDEIQHQFVVFVDVDDYVSPNYLKALYKHSSPNRIVIGQFYDQDEKTRKLQKTYFTDSLIKNIGIVDPNKLISGAILNAANKSMPSKYVKKVKFDQSLRSGDDLDYFCRLYANTDFEFYVVSPEENACYFRLIVSNSVSRQSISYEFNIIHRLEVMKAIDNTLINIKNKKMSKILLSAINDGQAYFILTYLRKFPNDYDKVIGDIKRFHIKNFNYEIFNYL